MNATDLITEKSRYAFAETLRRLEEVLQEKEIRVFAKIDYASAAEEVGLGMLPTTLLIFGKPASGTLLMQENQLLGLELPLKLLIWENKMGQTRVSYKDPGITHQEFNLGDDCLTVTGSMQALMRLLVSYVTL